ncbi:MAG: hypothetical protein H6993_13970, partial [Pseudomonadales bacterium]|nr:hypothetical protein [Pseudomonadales bacterium]
SNNIGYDTASPRLDYAISFNRAGTHYVWIRGIGATGSDDSLHAGLDGVPTATADRITGFSSAVAWSRSTMDGVVAFVSVPSAGTHTLNVWMREDGMVVDKIVVTSSDTYVPTGNGPAESLRGESLIFSSDAVMFSAASGSTTTQNQQVTLTTSDGGASTYSISDDATWLSVAPGTGSTPSGPITFTVNPTGLAPGVYVATVTATGSGSYGAGEATITFNVSPTLPFTRDFSSGNTSEWTIVDQSGDVSSWSVTGGALQQLNTTTATVHSATEIYTSGSFAALSNGGGLVDMRLSVDVQQTATHLEQIGADIGVLFRYVDAGNYYRLGVNSKLGFTELVRRQGGQMSTLAVNSRGYTLGQTVRLGVEVIGPVIRVFAADAGVGDIFATEPIFSVEDDTFEAGSIALYAQSQTKFDNLTISQPPAGRAVSVGGPFPFDVLTGLQVTGGAIGSRLQGGETVDAFVDSVACSAASQSGASFAAPCGSVPAGEHELGVDLRASGGSLLDSGSSVPFATGGDVFLTLGDSITNGVGDHFQSDNVSTPVVFSGNPVGSRQISIRGYQAVVHDLLEAAPGWTKSVALRNASVPGDKILNTLTRLPSVVSRFPEANRALVMIGVNDALAALSLSPGLGCSGAACDNTFKGELLLLVSNLRAAGVEPILARITPVFGSFQSTVFADPATATVNVKVRDYNTVIGEVTTEEGLLAGPDFYNLFFPTGEPRLTLSADNLHPGSLGHALMGYGWANVISGGSVPLPLFLTHFCLQVSSSTCAYPGTQSDAINYKQLYLEAGDPYAVDKADTLTSIPAVLEGGVWIRTANAHRNNTRATFMTFDVDRSVDVYVAYDSGITNRPTWLSSWTDTGQTVGVSSATGTLKLFKKSFTGPTTVSMGGASATGFSGTINENYLVIVKEP